MISQLDALTKSDGLHDHARSTRPRSSSKADMILRSCEASVPEASDRDDVRRRYDALIAVARAASGDCSRS